MKAKLIVDGKEIEVEISQEQVDEFCKAKLYRINYPDNNTYLVTSFNIGSNHTVTDKDYIEHGRYRHTKEQAEISLERNKRANRLEALAMSLPEWKPDGKYFIGYYDDEWVFNDVINTTYPETVMMPEACARKVCEILNDDRYSLEGEL